MSWLSTPINPNAREVKHESTYRSSSDACSVMIRQKDKTIGEAFNTALNSLQTKYMTGLSGREIFKALKLDDYFNKGIQFLNEFFELIREIQKNKLAENEFSARIIKLKEKFENDLPITHMFLPFLPPIELSEEEKREITMVATGTLTNKKYRRNILYKDNRLLFEYLLAIKNYDSLSDKDISHIFNGVQQIEEPLSIFYQNFYKLFMDENANTGEIFESAYEMIKSNFMELKNEFYFKDILIGLFGGEESLRLELKYSGVSSEHLTIGEAVEELKKALSLPFEKIGEFDKVRVHEGGLESALEEICKKRSRYPLMHSNLQKKTFIRSITKEERDKIWISLKEQNFIDYIANIAKEKGKEYNLETIGELDLENCYEELVGEHWTETIFNKMQEASISTPNEEGMKIVGSIKNIEKFNALESYFSKARGTQVTIDKGMRTKALVRGLNDFELSDAAKILFNTPSATKDDVIAEIARLFDDKEMYASVGIESVNEKVQRELKEKLPKIKAFIEKAIAYALTPPLRNLDITIGFINWLRTHVNDIHLVAESNDVYLRQMGKMTINSMIKELRDVFPIAERNSHLAIALITSLISRSPFEDLILDLQKYSAVIDEYTGEKVPFNKDANIWTQTNEIWIRHLRRERKEKVKDLKEEKKRETKEEKAKRIYHSIEEALIPYNYAMRKPEVSWAPLHLSTEAKILEVLKLLINNIELLDVKFILGREDIEVGEDKTLSQEVILKEVIASLIEEDYEHELYKLLERFQKMRGLASDDVVFIASEIIDIFNKSLAAKIPNTLDLQYFDKIREFSKKYVSRFTRGRFTTKNGRDLTLTEILDKMGPEFIELTKHRDYHVVRGLIGHIFEDSVLSYMKEFNQTYSSFDRDKVEEKMARALFGRGLKISYFTKLLNHLLQEKRKGSAEIGSETWIRYSSGCRYVLRRIDKTCYIIKAV